VTLALKSIFVTLRPLPRAALFLLLTLTAITAIEGCQLADDLDPPKCEKGFHIELEKCVEDKVAGISVTISPNAGGGTSCAGDEATQRPPTLDPETVRVKVNEEFQFNNKDVVDHEIKGVDGKVWLTVAAGKLSPFTSLTKAGNWGYRLSGCAKGGTVAVE
jgi:hypothetical protein